MRDLTTLNAVLDAAHVDAAVYALRPDYRALLLAVDGIEPGASDAGTEQLLQRAEAAARQALAATPVEALPHVAAWRDAYRAFGAKPQRTRNSLEALLRRAETGLPRVSRLTDAGVTCRPWNWRQARRTNLTDGTTAALFILDALAPLSDQALDAAADELVGHLMRLGPEVQVARRVLRPA